MSNLFQNIWDIAHAAGLKAVVTITPQIAPMVVQQRTNPFDDTSPVRKEWVVPDGPCGFAWVNVKPGTSKFARWLKEQKLARADSYYGGVTIWVSAFEQSVAKKEAYAYAFAKVLNDNNIKAYANSRLD